MSRYKVYLIYRGDTFGGSHRSSFEFSNHFKDPNIDYRYLILFKGPLTEFLKKNNIPHTCIYNGLFSNSFFLYFLINLSLFFRILLSFDFSWRSILHINDMKTAMYIFPFSFFMPPCFFHLRTRYASSRLSAICLSSYKGIICASEFSRKSLPISLLRKSYLINNRIFFNGDPSKTLTFPSASNFIISVIGSSNLQKRWDIVLKSIKHFNFPYHIFFIGKFSKDHFNFDLTQMSEITFLGTIDTAKNILENSHILISPSVHEGFGRVIIESFFSSTAVVASRSGAHPEIISHKYNGLLFNQDDPIHLAYQMNNLTSDSSLYYKLISGGHKSLQSHSLTSNYNSELYKVYNTK